MLLGLISWSLRGGWADLGLEGDDLEEGLGGKDAREDEVEHVEDALEHRGRRVVLEWRPHAVHCH